MGRNERRDKYYIKKNRGKQSPNMTFDDTCDNLRLEDTLVACSNDNINATISVLCVMLLWNFMSALILQGLIKIIRLIRISLKPLAMFFNCYCCFLLLFSVAPA